MTHIKGYYLYGQIVNYRSLTRRTIENVLAVLLRMFRVRYLACLGMVRLHLRTNKSIHDSNTIDLAFMPHNSMPILSIVALIVRKVSQRARRQVCVELLKHGCCSDNDID